MKATVSGVYKLLKEIGYPIAIFYLLLCCMMQYEIAVHQDEQIKFINQNQMVLSVCQINIAHHMIQLYHSVDHTHLEENKEKFKKDICEFRDLLQTAVQNDETTE